MQKPNYSDLIAVGVIVGLALFTAIVCFGILDSAAEGTLREYRVSGALAGALVSAGVFTSIYVQVRKSGDELRELRKELQELRLKVLRANPPPKGFTVEVDERRKLVFARPEEWGPYGGILFNFGLRLQDLANYEFPGHCEVLYVPIPKNLPTAESYYQRVEQHLKGNPRIVNSTVEHLSIGGDNDNIRALKVSGVQYLRFTVEQDEITSQYGFRWTPITEKEYLDNKDRTIEFGASGKTRFIQINRNQLYCYHAHLEIIFLLRCLDLPEHWAQTSETFNAISRSFGFLR